MSGFYEGTFLQMVSSFFITKIAKPSLIPGGIGNGRSGANPDAIASSVLDFLFGSLSGFPCVFGHLNGFVVESHSGLDRLVRLLPGE